MLYNMSAFRNIIRVDHEASRTHAWRVTVQRHNDIAVKTFSDAIHGGKGKALKAAEAYRDELLRRYSAYVHAIWVRTRLRRNNTSGIPGVGRYEEVDNPILGPPVSFGWSPGSTSKATVVSASSSVSHYGERQAKRLAVAERERQLNLVCARRVPSIMSDQSICPTHGGERSICLTHERFRYNRLPVSIRTQIEKKEKIEMNRRALGIGALASIILPSPVPAVTSRLNFYTSDCIRSEQGSSLVPQTM